MKVSAPGKPGFTTTVITPWGRETYQVLLREAEHLWIATIITLPNRIWAQPGGREALKFYGQSASEAEAGAVEFIEAERVATRRRIWIPFAETPPTAPSRSGVAAQPVVRPATRYATRLLLRFGSEETMVPGCTANVSESGLFVITDRPRSIGESVQIDLRVPEQPVDLWGTVVWVSPRKADGRSVGFGARLLSKPHEYLAWIQKLKAATRK